MRKKFLLWITGFSMCFFLSLSLACATSYGIPRELEGYFIRDDPVWKIVQIREGLEYEEAWQKIVDLISRKFDIEVLDEGAGYVRTAWKYGYGISREDLRRTNYKVRVVVKFPPEKHMRNKWFRVRTEANYAFGTTWLEGFDNRLLKEIYSDLQGQVGRLVK